MKGSVLSWLSTCSSSTVGDAAIPPPGTPTPSLKLLLSDTRSSSDNPGSSQETSSTNSSLQSSLSLLTLPSVPSLQNLSPENHNLSLTTRFLASLKPRPATFVNFLVVRNNLLYTASGNEVNVFDIANFRLTDKFQADSSSGSVKSIAFCKGRIFTAHQDCKIRVWKLTSKKQHKLIDTLPTIEDRFRNFILPRNYVKVRRHRKKLWVEHHDCVSGLTINDNFMCSVSWDKYLKIWSASDFRCIQSIKAHDDAINAVVVSDDGIIYTGSADRLIRVWRRPSTGEKKTNEKHVLIATLEKHKSAVNALALNPDGSVLFSGACDRSILVWGREDSANHMVVTGALRGHSKAVLCLINVNDLLFSGSADRTVRIWQRGVDGRYCCLTVLDGHAKPVRSLTAAPYIGEGGGGIKVSSGSFDGEIKVWEIMLSSCKTSPLLSDKQI